ncbi:PREDICTED: methionine-R-sulfoxide reductase B1, partial [Cariama cristata]|uniref:methionine-R-sulfoxide reductase B1 n=1 Tax=Cariama cristata TaxID=54380 RepID=UPI00051FFD77
DTVHEDSVAKRQERPGALKVSCGKCGNGLGHEFLNDGPKRGQSPFCIFTSSLQFMPQWKETSLGVPA